MEDNTIQKGHPNGLYLLFMSEMWERFSYYGMRAILTLYLTKALLFDKVLASNLYGGYVGLVYLTPLIGGFIADRYWGNRRSILVGGTSMAMGQFVLFLSATLRGTQISTFLLFLGLGMMIVGNGFFKPNISSMVGALYSPTDRRRDAAYTVFYMGINLGGWIGNVVCSFLGDTGNPDSFKWAFLSAGIAMTLGTLVFNFGKNPFLNSWEGKPVGVTPADSKIVNRIFFFLPILLAVCIGVLYVDAFYTNIVFPILTVSAIVITYIVFSDKSLDRIEKEKVAVIFIVSFFVVFFWAAFEQAPASLTYFADEQTDRNLFGYIVPPSLFQSLNSVFIVLLAPFVAMLWIFLGKRNLEPGSPMKMAIGLGLLTLGYIMMLFGVSDLDPTTKVSMFYLFGLYFLHTVGELCLSPIGLSLVTKLAPAKFISLLMAVWFLSTAIANKLAGMLSALYPDPKTGKVTSFLGFEIANLYDFFLFNAAFAGIAAIILFLISKRLDKMMHGIK